MIELTLVGGEQAVAKFKALGSKARQAISDALKREWFALQAHIVRNKLSGQVLRRVTGNLASSINVGGPNTLTAFEDTGNEIVGRVGTAVRYAAIHEYGGRVNIKAHSRRITQVFGKPVAEHEIFVRAHEANFPERSFLRSGLQDRSAQIRMSLEAALKQAMA